MSTHFNGNAPGRRQELLMPFLSQSGTVVSPTVPFAHSISAFSESVVLSLLRNLKALRPFRIDEFGTTAASPSKAHLDAANQLLMGTSEPIYPLLMRLEENGRPAEPPLPVQTFLGHKERLTDLIKRLEGVWDFYFNLFSQRQTRFGEMVLAADRIGLDCYQVTYTGLGRTRSIPSPAPFSYMETGHTPATVHRHVRLTRIQRQENPFPIVSLPYHRLVNPWTMGAVAHEIAHNLQSDLGLWEVVPQCIQQQLTHAGLPEGVVQVWVRWHKETWADLCAIFLSGPAVVTSLLEVIAASPGSTTFFNDGGVHPTPYLRALINFDLLRRIGFARQAAALEKSWRQMYPSVNPAAMPTALLKTYQQASQLVIDVIASNLIGSLGIAR